MKRKWIFLLIAAVLVVGALALVRSKLAGIAALPKPEASLPVVRVAVAASGTLEVFAHYQGSVEPLTKSDVSARISGNLLRSPPHRQRPHRQMHLPAVAGGHPQGNLRVHGSAGQSDRYRGACKKKREHAPKWPLTQDGPTPGGGPGRARRTVRQPHTDLPGGWIRG